MPGEQTRPPWANLEAFDKEERRREEQEKRKRPDEESRTTNSDDRDQPPAKSRATTSPTTPSSGSGLLNSINDPGFYLFIIGLLTFIFNEKFNNVTLAVLLGTIFMFYTAIFIFKGKGIIITAIFWVWYVFFGGVTDPTALMYIILPITLVGMLAHGVYNAISRRGTFLEGSSEELLGLIPILFFFLDLGLLPFLTKLFNFPITPLLDNFIRFTPWWALLGLFTTRKEGTIISLAKIVGVAYIFCLLTFGVAPEAYAASTSLLPGPEQFIEAKQELEQQLPQRENPFISNLACIFSVNYATVQVCVEQRQEISELRYICEKVEQQEPDTPAFEQCLAEQREKKQQKLVQGINDPTITEFTTAEFTISESIFPKTAYQGITNYPTTFTVDNPRQQQFQVKFSCRFEQGTEKIAGEIIGDNPITIQDASPAGRTVICKPGSVLQGRYKLVYEAELQGLQTTSRLQRLFIGTKDEVWKESWVPVITSRHFPSHRYSSIGPAEFARINFEFGNPTENPIIEGTGNLFLVSTIENVGTGKLAAVKSYHLQLDGFDIEDQSCLQGTTVTLPPVQMVRKSILPLTSCQIRGVPPELQQPENYLYREFEAALRYDYIISRSIDINIEKVSS